MPEIRYQKIRTDGNITAVVSDEVSIEDRPALAVLILRKDKEVEQVAFMSNDHGAGADIGMVMMGGEFCANAVRCIAFLHKKNSIVRVKTNFAKSIKVVTEGDVATISLPGAFIRGITKVSEGHLVDMAGIKHLIIGTTYEKQRSRALSQKYIGDSPAFGIINLRKEGRNYTILPYIFVRDTGSFINETACASGSIAVAAVLFSEREGGNIGGDDNNYSIIQPNGKIYEVVVKADKSGIAEISLRSGIEYLGEGFVDFEPA